MKKQTAAGFTLIELAIALMVIGLLIGGVLKGQELIENTRILQTVRQMTEYETALLMFRNNYNALPGDMTNPSARLPNCTTAPCNFVGTGNGLIEEETTECRSFWAHLERAGLIKGGDETADRFYASPPNPFGGYTNARALIPTNPLLSLPPDTYINFLRPGVDGPSGSTMNVTRAKRLDEKGDDGKPMSGNYQLYTSLEVCYDTGTYEYLPHDPSLRCVMTVNFPSLNR